MRVLYRYSIEVICAVPGDPNTIQGILRDRASYDERVAKCLFCSNEPVMFEILLSDDDKLYYFLIQSVIHKAFFDKEKSRLLNLARIVLKSLNIEYHPTDPLICDVTKKNEREVNRLFEVMTGLPGLPGLPPISVTCLDDVIIRLPACCYPKRPSSFSDNVFYLETQKK